MGETLREIVDNDALLLEGIEEGIIFHGFGVGDSTLEARVRIVVEAPDGSVWEHESVRYFKMRRQRE